MFALSQLVDIPLLFQRLDALPRELATARQELWAINIQVDEAERDCEEAQKIAHEEHTKKYPDSLPAGPLPPSDAMKKAHGYRATLEDEWSACKVNLADLNSEMLALRAKVDLITALARQVEIVEMPSLTDQVWKKLRGDDFMGGSGHGTTKP